jgi:DNA topoisomerase-1
MAKKPARGKQQKSLVIVESPAKARTISKFLGGDFMVEASIGHVRDLPQGAKEVPDEFKKEDWAYLGVNVQDDFRPVYIVPHGKKQQVTKLRKALKESKDLYLATDEDREGEAISWHLCQLLKPKVPVHRLVFHEITRPAIAEALSHPRDIDEGLVRAQETRRILDRLFGYDVSQLLWKKVGPGLSAGRVQSVAVRLIVQRERERMSHVAATYWDLLGVFAKQDGQSFSAISVSIDGRRIPRAKDFDAATGQLKDSSLLWLDGPAAQALAERLRQTDFRVSALEVKPFTEKPKAPFTTSTLQQEANRKLGFTARRTMTTAQSLYENGFITYMRTDSTTLAEIAVKAARQLVRSEYGPEYLFETPRVYSSKVKNAQEAHEAIRPAGTDFPSPQSLKDQLNSDQFKLYDLIWKRTVASQMADARKRRSTITVEGGGVTFQASGTTVDFDGFLRAYVEGLDDNGVAASDRDPTAVDTEDKDRLLPAVQEGERLRCDAMEPKDHTTQPPSRYTEASLTRTLEEKGIGRPSTYATIIETIQARDYVFKKGSALVPSWTAFSVVRLLEEHLPSLVDYEFTAQMEDLLDAISRRETEHVQYLYDFYFGDGKPGLKRRLEHKEKEIDPRVASRFAVGTPDDGELVVLRVGKYGPFLEHGERKASLPAGMAPDELTLERALELLEHASREEEPLGFCPETGRPVYVKRGRFGPYVQLGSSDDEAKPRNASLLKNMEPQDVTLDTALQLLSLPRTVGDHPETKEPIVAHNGRYGPYIKCGDETRSLPASLSPLEIALPEALELLAQPKTGGRGRGASREPLQVFGDSPVTESPVKLFNGRYGPYVTDGVTNASLPKGVDPQQVNLETALQWLAERAARGPAKKKAARKKATAKKAASKKQTPANKKTSKTTKAKKAPKAAKSAAPRKKASDSSAKKSRSKKSP